MHTEPPNVDVVMFHPDLPRAPGFSLPLGYTMRFYRDGDVHTWLGIQAADPFFAPTADTFAASLPGDTAHLATRVMFLVDPAGAAVGTITAWNTALITGRDIGQIHWVAILPHAQGRGLAKPMLSAACDVLRERGYAEACLETNTRRIPALNLYLLFGFVPLVRDVVERDAWRVVAPRLKHRIDV